MIQQHLLGARSEGTGTHFGVWSDKAREVRLRWTDPTTSATREVDLSSSPTNSRVYEVVAEQVRPGMLYEFLLDGVSAVDPYARSLPGGVHGPAEVVAPLKIRVHEKRAIKLDRGEVFYELHVGTFTSEGTFASAVARLDGLAKLGVTVIELMPVAAFAGRRGWGYDGVGLFAPFAGYGTAQDLSSLVDTAHGIGLSVVLDVVYNHLGPDGNYLPRFSDEYFASNRESPWGKAPAFAKTAFRQLVLDNARYWLEEVGFDGLRLDATHELEPGGNPHILDELAGVARGCVPPAVLIAEDDRNDPRATLSHGVDGVWSDDFHHAVHVLLTSERDGYYGGYSGQLTELARVIERGHLYEGQVFPPTGSRRGQPVGNVPRQRLIYSLQNHDQVGNRAFGERLDQLCDRRQLCAVTALLLALPATPMLFMGQEHGARTPFLYFTDHVGDLGSAVAAGRRQQFADFAAFRDAAEVPDPQAESTFLRSKLTWEQDGDLLALHRDALMLRRDDAVLGRASQVQAGVESSVLWVLSTSNEGRRLIVLNPNAEVTLDRIAGVAPSECQLLLTTDSALRAESSFKLPSHSCAIFAVAEARAGA
ncbi:MAG: malto-oligosyltrehalose trehalohydrolase [Polyangiaceae bacterium]